MDLLSFLLSLAQQSMWISLKSVVMCDNSHALHLIAGASSDEREELIPMIGKLYSVYSFISDILISLKRHILLALPIFCQL